MPAAHQGAKQVPRPRAQALAANESEIVAELNGAQGSPQNLGGYYMPDARLADAAMRPSATLNGILEKV